MRGRERKGEGVDVGKGAVLFVFLYWLATVWARVEVYDVRKVVQGRIAMNLFELIDGYACSVMFKASASNSNVFQILDEPDVLCM